MQARLSVEDEGHKRQRWRLTEHGHLQCQAGGFCVDIDGKKECGDTPDQGANVIMWAMKLPNPAYPEATNQMWVYDGSHFTSKMNGTVLSLAYADLFGEPPRCDHKPESAGVGMGVEVFSNFCVTDPDGPYSRQTTSLAINRARQMWTFE